MINIIKIKPQYSNLVDCQSTYPTMKNTNYLILIFCLLGTGLFGQSIEPKELVKAQKGQFEKFELLRIDSKRGDIPEITKLSKYSVLELDRKELAKLSVASPDAISIVLPIDNTESIELQLVKYDFFTDDYTMIEEPSGRIIEIDRGNHYRGIIKGNDKSLVAISIYENEVAGFVSHPKYAGNFVLGKRKKTSKSDTAHMIYLDTDMTFETGRVCETEDVGPGYKDEDLKDHSDSRALSDCVRLLLEVDYNMYQTLGSTATAANNYMNTLFNGISTIYGGENINTVLSQTYFWSSTSPYTGSSTSAKLNSFQNNRNNFNGDFAQLLTNINFGGLAAAINSVCGSENSRMCVSGVLNQIQNVPTYSFDMEIACHEYGHLFGSYHTHGCYWNGNNTQIDDCASVLGNTEGAACYDSNNPILPSNGGTIMSYCYAVSGVGVNFSNGFGTQPGNAIRSAVSSGSCLQPCGGGGGCTDNELTLNITTDNYPGETTWTVTSGSTTVASGGPYSTANTSYSEDICLPDGCYTFTINDSYGDGICCSYGSGSYTLLASDGSTIKTGGSFTTSESTDFCEPTGGGGSDCTEINFNDYTVVAYGNGQDNGTSSDVGGGAGRALFNNAWKSIALNYTVTSSTVIEFEFGSTTQGEIHGLGFDNNASISSGFTFQFYGTQNWGNRDFDYTSIGNWQAFTVPVGIYYTGSFDRLFFVDDHDGSPGNGNSYFRNIKIYEGGSCSGFANNNEALLAVTRGAKTEMVDGLPDELVESTMELYPNPALDQINISIGSSVTGLSFIEIRNLTGQLINRRNISLSEGNNRFSIDAVDMHTGIYLVSTEINGRRIMKKISVLK
jgi:hypothetical protein